MKIKLTGPHTHAGKDYLAGDTLEVEDHHAKSIIDFGKGEELKPFAAATTTTKSKLDTEL